MINQLTKKIADVLSEEQMDYSAQKKIIEPFIFEINYRLQDVNSLILESTPYTFTESDAIELFGLVYSCALTKGKIYRYIENSIWNSLVPLPFKLNTAPEDDDFIELESNPERIGYINEIDRINQRFIDLCFKILDLKRKRQNFKIRRENAIKIVGNMLNFYAIPQSYNYFKRSISYMDSKEQYFALQGFERYFLLHEEEIPDDLLIELRHIFETTKKREIASTCLEIEMNVGLIEEFEVVFKMDNWKEKNRTNDYDKW